MCFKKRLEQMLTSFAVLLFVCGIGACSAKKASKNYGDNKVYLDEDSSGGSHAKEKNSKMPFDTSAAPLKIVAPSPNM